MERSFYRCTVRQLLGLVAVVGVLLALVAPPLQRRYWQRRQVALNQQMFAAAAIGDSLGVTQAIAAGADPNTCDEESNTPLGLAMRTTDLPLVNELLEAGANPDLPFGRGPETLPLQYAVEKCDGPAFGRI